MNRDNFYGAVKFDQAVLYLEESVANFTHTLNYLQSIKETLTPVERTLVDKALEHLEKGDYTYFMSRNSTRISLLNIVWKYSVGGELQAAAEKT